MGGFVVCFVEGEFKLLQFLWWRLMKRIIWQCKIVVVDCIYRNSILEVVNYKSIQNQIYEIWIKLVETCMYGSSHIFFFWRSNLPNLCNKCKISQFQNFPLCKSFFKDLQEVKNWNGSIVVIITRFFWDENTSFFENNTFDCARV